MAYLNGIVSSPLSLSGGTVTASNPVLNLSQTWNNAAVTFTGYKLNVTDTASNASSLLMDLQVGGTSKFRVDKSGNGYFAPAASSVTTGIFLNSQNTIGLIGYNALYNSFYFGPPGVNNYFSFNVGNNAFRLTSSNGAIEFNGAYNSGGDLILTRRGAANLRFGAADAAAPVGQTLSVQSVVAGTTNTAGANLTITGSQGTGTGAGGSIVFQVAPAGSTGTAQNALVNALTIDSSKNATFGNGLIVQNGGGGSTGLAFGSFSNGFYMPPSSSIYAMNAGNVVFEFGTSYAQVTSVLTFGGAGIIGDLRLYKDASGTLAQRNGVNAQTTKIYGTYTDASNYERLSLSANSTAAYITAEEAGTGTARDLYIGANNATTMVVAANGNIIANNTLFVANGISTTANTVDIYALPANPTLQSAALVYSNGSNQGSTLYLRPSSTAYNGNYGLYQVANGSGGFIFTGGYNLLTINSGNDQARILSLQTYGGNTNIGGIVNIGNTTVNTVISSTTISLINISLVGF